MNQTSGKWMSDGFDNFDIEPDFDERSNRQWLVELAFWRPALLTDAEMESLFPGHDGRWSRQTKSAIEKHRAKGLDLNQSWALVEQSWFCPVCRRNKVDIFRLSGRGILLANLEEHHDHLRDYVGRRARALFGDRWGAELPPGCAAIADTLEHLVSSFSGELVCSECNAADGKAKLMMKGVIPPYFSFSPSEIRNFIEPAPNADHRISEDRVKSIWHAREASVRARIDMIDQTLHMIQAGTLHRERGTSSYQRALRHFDPQYQLYKSFLRESGRDQRGRELLQLTGEFLARSVQKDSPILSPKLKASLNTAPTEAEYRAYVDAVSPRRWRETPEDWLCPVCRRAKRALLRKSGSGKWTGGIRDLIEAVAETDPVSIKQRQRTLPGFSHGYVMKGSQTTRVCSDCADIIPQIKSRRRDLTDIYLGVDDLRSCIQAAAPHVSHDVDWQEAARRAQLNQPIGPAWEAYEKHRSLASSLRQIFKVFARDGGEARGIEEAAEELIFIAKIDDKLEAIRLTRWLLQEDARFDAETSRRRAEYQAQNANREQD